MLQEVADRAQVPHDAVLEGGQVARQARPASVQVGHVPEARRDRLLQHLRSNRGDGDVIRL